MVETAFTPGVAGDRLTVADELILVGRETFEADRPPCVKFARADAQLCAEAVTEAVGESRRGVVIDARRVNALKKKREAASLSSVTMASV